MKRTWKWHFYFVRQHLLDISPNKNGQNQVASVLWETFNNWKDGRNTTVQEINEEGFFNWFQRKYIVRGSWFWGSHSTLFPWFQRWRKEYYFHQCHRGRLLQYGRWICWHWCQFMNKELVINSELMIVDTHIAMILINGKKSIWQRVIMKKNIPSMLYTLNICSVTTIYALFE